MLLWLFEHLAGFDSTFQVLNGAGVFTVVHKNVTKVVQVLGLVVVAFQGGVKRFRRLVRLATLVLAQVAASHEGPPVGVGIRVNPDVTVDTHPFISTGTAAATSPSSVEGCSASSRSRPVGVTARPLSTDTMRSNSSARSAPGVIERPV